MTSPVRIVIAALALVPLFAATHGALASQESHTLAVYDVRDILATSRDFPMRRFNAEDRARAEAEKEKRTSTHDRFVAGLTRHLRQAGIPRRHYSIETPEGGGAAAGKHGHGIGGMLILKATPAAHQAVVAYLARRRTLAETIIHVETRIFRVRHPEKDLPRGLRSEPIGEQDLLFMLDATQAQGAARNLGALAKKKGSGVTVIAAPRISTYHGQRANITIANQHAYIADFNLVKVLGGKTMVADPVVKTIEVGMGLEVKVDVEAGAPARGRIEVVYQNAELERPIEEKRTEHGTIQIPRVTSVDLEFAVNLPLPGDMLMASRARPGRGVDLVLLHFERHERSDLLKKRKASVKAAGPILRDKKNRAHRVIYISAGKRHGLENGLVRIFRPGAKGEACIVGVGLVARAYEDACEVRVPVEPEAPALSTEDLSTWWAEWGARKSKRL